MVRDHHILAHAEMMYKYVSCCIYFLEEALPVLGVGQALVDAVGVGGILSGITYYRILAKQYTIIVSMISEQKKQGYVGRQSCLSSGLDLTLVFLYLKVLSIFVTAALSAPFPFVAAILIFASFCFSCAEASDAHAAQSHNMCSNSSPNHTAQLRTSSHNIQLRNKQLRAKAGTIAGKVVDAEGQVEGFMFG